MWYACLMSKYWHMPSCNKKDIEFILERVRRLRPSDQREVQKLIAQIGAKELCRILHAMRRWYSYNTGNAAWKIIAHRKALSAAMDLRPRSVVGAFRGFKVAKNDPIARKRVGDIFSLPVTRNGGCSSWTLDRKRANNFSGASKGKVGIVIRLAKPTNVVPFIAPPKCSKAWFNRLYEATMGQSFRLKENEYAVCGRKLWVQIVAIKK